MTRPEFYAHGPETVELRQTHISWVLLAGDRVYKVKKPVRFAFVDYSTLERRRFYCDEEIRLNRRLADAVYLGVRPIVRRHGGFALGHGAAHSEIEDYAVEMRRLAEDETLERRVAAGRTSRGEVARIAARLVDFHTGCATDEALRYGSAEAIAEMVRTNALETRAVIADTVLARELDAIDDCMQRLMEQHHDVFATRARSGRVREVHGDLRAEHVYVGDEIVVIDCVEFSERLRTCDVASEIAFLGMDLDRLRAADLADALAEAYAEQTGDLGLLALLSFYKAYRAYVRGKVESLRSREEEIPEDQRAHAKILARRYFNLVRRYLHGPRGPGIVVVCGLSATGKSTVATLVEDLTGFAMVSSDAVRKGLAGTAPGERRADGYRQGLYSDEFTRKTYQALIERADERLRRGGGVVIDATFKDAMHRRLVLDLAERRDLTILFIECSADENEIARRFDERKRRPDETSDATWDTYVQQRREFAPLSEIPEGQRIRLNTARHQAVVVADLERALERLGEPHRGTPR